VALLGIILSWLQPPHEAKQAFAAEPMYNIDACPQASPYRVLGREGLDDMRYCEQK
jgi:hypothetical protein